MNNNNNDIRIVKIAFYKQDSENVSFSDWVATLLTTRPGEKVYSHVELVFSDGHVTSVTQNPGYVHYEKRKQLGNPRYSLFYEIHMPKKSEWEMQQYAKAAFENRVEFNKVAMYWNFMPCMSCFAIQSNGKSFFCSEYIVTLLQRAGYLTELNAHLTSPSELMYVMKQKPKKFLTSLNDKTYVRV